MEKPRTTANGPGENGVRSWKRTFLYVKRKGDCSYRKKKFAQFIAWRGVIPETVNKGSVITVGKGTRKKCDDRIEGDWSEREDLFRTRA